MTSNGEEQGCKSTLEIPIIHFTVSERERGCDEREETEKIDDENERRQKRNQEGKKSTHSWYGLLAGVVFWVAVCR